MEISTEKLRALSERYGDAFYLLDSKQFEDNYQRLKRAFVLCQRSSEQYG